ncbi:MAG: ABC transporter substrate-binding protein [Hyphomicrobiales bacterium]|nr:ABC transporter substrate-binding protein [Hyphomicrobiales bacterium]
MAVAVLAIAAGLLYLTVSGDYAFLKASVLTGSPTGQYHATGERLAARARKKNGRLDVVATAGSVENVARLVGENGHCVPAFAFVQDGLPLPADAGLETLGRLPQPESLIMFARRGRATDTFRDLKGASVGIGPNGSGTNYLMRQLMENSDLKDLGLKLSNHGLEAQAELVRDGELDLAAFVMNENAELMRTFANAYDLEIVAPADIEGLVARDKWLRLGRIPAGFYNLSRPTPATDKLVAQVDTLVMTNACVHRAQRLAFLMLLNEEFPNFVRMNPPPSPKSEDAAPLSDEAREFFANGGPELADRYFPRLVNLMSPAYWIYLAMAVTILFNAMNAYSRFRLWRIDANRELLEARLKALSGLGAAPEHMKTLPPEAILKTPQDRQAAEDLMKDLKALRLRCEDQLRSMITPMGREMYYRYQESLIKDAQAMLADLLRRSS